MTLEGQRSETLASPLPRTHLRISISNLTASTATLYSVHDHGNHPVLQKGESHSVSHYAHSKYSVLLESETPKESAYVEADAGIAKTS